LWSDEVVNPFHVPSTGPRSLAPLRPWKEHDHVDFYVPVDQTLAAFHEFGRRLHEDGPVQARGRLVVVIGEKGCGKTSLINRCVHHLVTTAAAGTQLLVADVCRESVSVDSVEARMNELAERVVDDLRAQRVFSEDWLSAFEDQLTASAVYRLLGNWLAQHGDMLAVLLPPTELLFTELEQYALMARERMIFFAESADHDEVDTALEQMRAADRDEVVRLQVHPLNKGDGWRFAQARLNGYRGSQPVPGVSETTMEALQELRNDMSLEELQTVLFEVWEDVAHRSLPVQEVSWNDIASWYVARFNQPEYRRKPYRPRNQH
jgi:hypothetical protein